MMHLKLSEFEMPTNLSAPAKRPDVELIYKKKIDFLVLGKQWVKMKNK